MKQKILVTGSNGQLGNELRDLAIRFPQFEFLFVSRAELSIEDDDKVSEYFATNQPQYCINCAAYTAVDKAETEMDIALKINADAVQNLAANCTKYNTQFIHISTDYVFDGTLMEPYNEKAPVKPVNAYGYSKLQGEIKTVTANPSSIIIRTSWVYSTHGKNFVKTMLRLMSENKNISVVCDQFGCPTYGADLAQAIMDIIVHIQTQDSDMTSQAGIYHFSNAGITTWYDFAIAIRDGSGYSSDVSAIPTSAYPTPAKRPINSVLDNSKIQKVFGIQPKAWQDSLKECLAKLIQ